MHRYPVVFALALCLTLSACVLGHPRVTQDLDVPEPPAQAFRRAVGATMAIQATIVQQDQSLGIISARAQQHVALNVVIRPHGAGSQIQVAHQVDSDVVSLATVTVASDWIAAYHRQP